MHDRARFELQTTMINTCRTILTVTKHIPTSILRHQYIPLENNRFVLCMSSRLQHRDLHLVIGQKIEKKTIGIHGKKLPVRLTGMS